MSVYISGSKKGMRARDPFLVAKRKRPTVKSVARSVKRMQSRVELKTIKTLQLLATLPLQEHSRY